MNSENFTRRVLVGVVIAVLVRLVGPFVWKTPSEKKRDQENRQSQEELARDMEQLRRLEETASASGTAAAQVALGWKCAGSGDFERAAALFEKAAEAGEQSSASALANIYASRRLLDPDHMQAYKWYCIACDDAIMIHADSGSDDCRLRDQTAGQLSPSDQARTKALVEAWESLYRK